MPLRHTNIYIYIVTHTCVCIYVYLYTVTFVCAGPQFPNFSAATVRASCGCHGPNSQLHLRCAASRCRGSPARGS